MRSGFQRIALMAGVLFLTFSLQFGLSLAGAPVALAVAVLLGVGDYRALAAF